MPPVDSEAQGAGGIFWWDEGDGDVGVFVPGNPRFFRAQPRGAFAAVCRDQRFRAGARGAFDAARRGAGFRAAVRVMGFAAP